jgi:proteasome lid subunit RPN8/RPN11
MRVTIDRSAIDRMLDTLGQSVPERDGEQMGLLGVAKRGGGDHISYFAPIPPHSATSKLVTVNHDVMNGIVMHTMEPYDMAVGGMMHTQPRGLTDLSPLDMRSAREYMGSFKQFYGPDTPGHFISTVMSFDAQRNPRITTWAFDAANPNRNPTKAKMDVTTSDGRRMEVNDYIQMRQHNAPALNQFFDTPGQRR